MRSGSMSACLTLFVLCGVAAQSQAQQRQRQISWVNSDIPQIAGLQHKVLGSKSMRHDVGFVVWTPPEFDKSGQTRYPVLYFLHGAGGSEKSDSAGFSSRVATAILEKKFPTAICVFPNGGMSGYRNDVEAMIVDELIPLIDNSYPTNAEAAGRAVCGFSMGGAGAVHLSLRHPGLFCAAASWGGALSFRGNAAESPLLATAKDNAEELQSHGYALLTINGDQDRPDAFKALREILEPLGVTHEIVTLENTDHNLGKYYERSTDQLLEFLADQFADIAESSSRYSPRSTSSSNHSGSNSRSPDAIVREQSSANRADELAWR